MRREIRERAQEKIRTNSTEEEAEGNEERESRVKSVDSSLVHIMLS